MAIDPITPVSSMPATQSVGADPAAHAQALQALAKAAVADNVAMLGALVGDGKSPSLAGTKGSSEATLTPTPPALTDPVEQSPATIGKSLSAAVRSATALAAPRQAGLAPMMANLGAIVRSPNTPEPVRQAARDILDKALATDQPLSSQTFRAAVRGSGLFLESRLARTVPNERLAIPSTAQAQLPAPQAPDGVDMKAALLVFKAVVSTWVAKVPHRAASAVSVADASESAAAPQATSAPAKLGTSHLVPSRLPEPGSMAHAGLDADIGPMAKTEAKSSLLDLSGGPAVAVPRGARVDLAASVTPAIAHAPGAAAPAASRQPATAASLNGVQIRGPQPADASVLDNVAPEPDAQQALVTSSQNRSPRREAPPQAIFRGAMLNVGLIEEEPLELLPLTRDARPAAVVPGHAATAARAGPPSRPPPPYAGGPTTGQPVALPDLPVDMHPSDVARHLLTNSQATLARQELLQIASLPEARRESEGLAETKSSRWMFDLPFQTPQGIAVAQFEISRDGGGGGADTDREEERTWRARFSMDIEPLGPVHVQIALTGARTRVGFWAERPEAVARLQAGEGALSAALREADLSPEVAFHDGAPVMAPSPLGRFVDRES